MGKPLKIDRKQLLDSYRDYIANNSDREAHAFRSAIARICKHLGISAGSPHSWNQAINWLDTQYPGWRGYPNPPIINADAPYNAPRAGF